MTPVARLTMARLPGWLAAQARAGRDSETIERRQARIQPAKAAREEQGQGEYFVPKKVRHLSVTEHRLVLCEYVEQTPMLLSNPGMASHVCTYYKPRGPDDRHLPTVEDGRVLVMDGAEEEPFELVQVQPGQTLTTLTNNLYTAPLVRHTPATTDFVLTRYAKKLAIAFSSPDHGS